MSPIVRLVSILFLGVLLATAATAAPSADPSTATGVVRSATDRVVKVLAERRAQLERDPSLLYGVVDGILVPNFDFEMITRAAVGRPWNDASPAQRTSLTNDFQRLLIRTYAKALLSYSGQTIRFQPERPGSRADTAVVSTLIDQPGAEPVPIEYRLRQKDGVWKVYDVIISGVSLVANYRGTFADEVRKGGIDGLVRSLSDLAAGKKG